MYGGRKREIVRVKRDLDREKEKEKKKREG